MPAAIRLIHPAPALAVIALTAALGAILATQAGVPIGDRWLFTVLAVAGSQVFTGATNDIADRFRDAAVRPEKPLPAGEAEPQRGDLGRLDRVGRPAGRVVAYRHAAAGAGSGGVWFGACLQPVPVSDAALPLPVPRQLRPASGLDRGRGRGPDRAGPAGDPAGRSVCDGSAPGQHAEGLRGGCRRLVPQPGAGAGPASEPPPGGRTGAGRRTRGRRRAADRRAGPTRGASRSA